ncbi:YciI family protein [Brevibacillus ginsengisoli]|uniref:YciI family protein n=1 Tax=Brevibacillus ginsengisoli TaxID=363854 RepID=UPI003CF40D30
MLYVAFLPIIDQELNAKERPAHLDYINRLYLDGKVVMAGPFTDKRGGLVIYKTDTMEEAELLAKADPAVTSGARTLELREWNPLELPLG